MELKGQRARHDPVVNVELRVETPARAETKGIGDECHRTKTNYRGQIALLRSPRRVADSSVRTRDG